MVSVLNPFVNYLHDSYALLNLALHQHAFSSDNTTFLARSSAMHAIGAVHTVANTCLQSIASKIEGQPMPETLVEKFSTYLRLEKSSELDRLEVSLLEELETIGKMLALPQAAESYDFWRPSDDRVTDFARTPLKKIPCNITHWQTEFSGAVLGMAVSVIKRLLVDRCGHCASDLEKLFGMQFSTPDSHAVAFDEQLIESLRTEQEVLVNNTKFMERMASIRWKIRQNDFRIDLETTAARPACMACKKLKMAG
ncbi:MAG: hypothetical protein ACI9R3_004165 [Verrucomicrobiales bacterium]|jgi:hypothetical protein